MSARQQMNDLALRKRMLLVEGELSRRLIQTEFAELRARSVSNLKNPVVTGGFSVAAGGAIVWLLKKGRWKHLFKSVPIVLSVLRFVQRRRPA